MQHRSSKSLQEEVLSMRFLMKEKRKKARKYDLVDVKHDKGGLIDIEFIVQYYPRERFDVPKALREHRQLCPFRGHSRFAVIACFIDKKDF